MYWPMGIEELTTLSTEGTYKVCQYQANIIYQMRLCFSSHAELILMVYETSFGLICLTIR